MGNKIGKQQTTQSPKGPQATDSNTAPNNNYSQKNQFSHNDFNDLNKKGILKNSGNTVQKLNPQAHINNNRVSFDSTKQISPGGSQNKNKNSLGSLSFNTNINQKNTQDLQGGLTKDRNISLTDNQSQNIKNKILNEGFSELHRMNAPTDNGANVQRANAQPFNDKTRINIDTTEQIMKGYQKYYEKNPVQNPLPFNAKLNSEKWLGGVSARMASNTEITPEMKTEMMNMDKGVKWLAVTFEDNKFSEWPEDKLDKAASIANEIDKQLKSSKLFEADSLKSEQSELIALCEYIKKEISITLLKLDA